MMDFDSGEFLKRVLKYVVEGLVVAVVALVLVSKKGKGKVDWNAVLLLGLTAALTFSLLDTFAPSCSLSSRLGSGLTLGSKLVGGM